MSNINETKQNTAEVEAVTRAKMAEKNDADVKQGSSAKKFLMAILVIAIIVALALLVINAVIDSYANAFAEVDIDNAQATVEKLTDMSVHDAYMARVANGGFAEKTYLEALKNHAYSSENIVAKETVFTFALFSINQDGDASTIIVASLNKETRQISYVTLAGTTLVYIPSADVVASLADAYLWGGAPLLARTIQSNYGVSIDSYIKVDYTAISSVVDALGGVTVGSEVVTGDNVVSYIKENENGKGEAVKAVTKATVETLFSKGIGGIFSVLNAAKDSKGLEASIARDDFGTLVQLAFGAATNVSNTVTVGANDRSYPVPEYSTCDYATERATMINTLFGANK